MVHEEQNEHRVRAFYKATVPGHREALRGLQAPQVVYDLQEGMPIGGGHFEGLEDVLERFLTNFYGAFDVRFVAEQVQRAGLEGLSEVLRNRTSVEPGDPAAIDLERDEPRLYPLIYWPITSSQPNLSPRASATLDRYLRTGGILFIDTRDQQLSFDRPAGGNPDLKRLMSGIETPPLIVMPPDHVLTKSFYLLSDMPGRWTGGKVWIESGSGRVNDGTTTIIIGANDYAGAWAVDARRMSAISRGLFTARSSSSVAVKSFTSAAGKRLRSSCAKFSSRDSRPSQ